MSTYTPIRIWAESDFVVLIVTPERTQTCIGRTYVIRHHASHAIMCDLSAILESLPVGTEVEVFYNQRVTTPPTWLFKRPKGEAFQ